MWVWLTRPMVGLPKAAPTSEAASPSWAHVRCVGINQIRLGPFANELKQILTSSLNQDSYRDTSLCQLARPAVGSPGVYRARKVLYAICFLQARWFWSWEGRCWLTVGSVQNETVAPKSTAAAPGIDRVSRFNFDVSFCSPMKQQMC